MSRAPRQFPARNKTDPAADWRQAETTWALQMILDCKGGTQLSICYYFINLDTAMQNEDPGAPAMFRQLEHVPFIPSHIRRP